MTVTIALDCMGGDHGAKVTVPAAEQFLRRHPDCRMVLVGRQSELDSALMQIAGGMRDALRVQDATEVVEMGDSPAVALRSKRDSSMRVAVDLVRAGEADACVSAGNTGALMAISRFVLKMMPGVERPAIASMLPTLKEPCCMLDLGANVNCTAVHLLQFAVMGSSLYTAVYGKANPTVGLLNIGEEDIKGNEIAKQAGELLKASGLNYFGNVEGDDVYKGSTDVVVCDGFVGNVFLKGSEGLARMLAAYLRQEYERTLWNKLAALFSMPAIGAFRKRVDPRRYNGASLLGLRGIVVKSHGSADSLALEIALERAYHEARNKILDSIASHMPQMLEKAG